MPKSASPWTALGKPLFDWAVNAEQISGDGRTLATSDQCGSTRVHRGRVEGLAVFLKLEMVLHEGEDARCGMAEGLARLTGLDVRPP